MKEKKIVYVFVGIVKNSHGEVLMTKRSEKELKEADNKWELPGGKVDFGETPQAAVEREIREETGYSITVTKLLPQPFVSFWRYPDFDQHTIIFCYECELRSEKQQQTSDHHVKEIHWIEPTTLEESDCLPGLMYFINLAKAA